jgi:hypothetical protein
MPPLKIFIYPKEACHLEPDYAYRELPVLGRPNPDYFEVVADPAAADFIVLPVLLNNVGASHQAEPDYLYSYLPRLPYYREFEEKHVFFLLDVDTWAPLFTKAVQFRHSVHRRFPDLNALAYPYYPDHVPGPPTYDGLSCHTFFSGFLGSWKGRIELLKALSQVRGLNCVVRGINQFHLHQPAEERARNRQFFLESMHRTLTVCCPRGAGLNSIRFFETLGYGRIPILISDDVVLPLEYQVNYDRFVLRVPEGQMANIGVLLHDWMDKIPPGEMAQKCAAARQAWDDYLCPARREQLVWLGLQRVRAAHYQLNLKQASEVALLRRSMAGTR